MCVSAGARYAPDIAAGDERDLFAVGRDARFGERRRSRTVRRIGTGRRGTANHRRNENQGEYERGETADVHEFTFVESEGTSSGLRSAMPSAAKMKA